VSDAHRALHRRQEHPLSWPAIRRHGRLAVGVTGTLGGGILLGSNIAYVVMSGATTLPWIPLSANAALVLGGAMFLWDYRRAPRKRDVDPEADR
jgi:hypothetical protein